PASGDVADRVAVRGHPRVAHPAEHEVAGLRECGGGEPAGEARGLLGAGGEGVGPLEDGRGGLGGGLRTAPRGGGRGGGRVVWHRLVPYSGIVSPKAPGTVARPADGGQVRCPSSAYSAAACRPTSSPSSGVPMRCSRAAGEEMLRAPSTAPAWLNTGAPTQPTPSSYSSLSTA